MLAVGTNSRITCTLRSWQQFARKPEQELKVIAGIIISIIVDAVMKRQASPLGS